MRSMRVARLTTPPPPLLSGFLSYALCRAAQQTFSLVDSTQKWLHSYTDGPEPRYNHQHWVSTPSV